jgi:hypothetical protein
MIAGCIDMRWNIAVSLATDFVLAMALTLGGRAMNGTHVIVSNSMPLQKALDCCARSR